MSEYPRNHDVLRREATRDPISLFQSRRPVWYPEGSTSAKCDHEAEGFVDHDGNDPTTAEAIEREAGTWRWHTETVFLTRSEGEAWGRATDYSHPNGWRVYCVAAAGALCDVLAGATEGGRYL